MNNKANALISLAAIFFIGLGCGKLASIGQGDMLTGTNAKNAVDNLKSHIGAADLRVIRAEVRSDKLVLVVQAPDNPKNIDEYTYAKGSVSGPEPVKVFSMGEVEMTADKYHTTSVDDIDWAAIRSAVTRAKELSKLESPTVDLVSMSNESSKFVNPQIKGERERELAEVSKELSAKRDECRRSDDRTRCREEIQRLDKRESELRFGRDAPQFELTWRIFVEGPRGRRDFWADRKGNVNEAGF